MSVLKIKSGNSWVGVTSIKGEKGDTGNTGATPDFSVGTVTTGEAGSSASASITGTAEAPVLNLTIPKGDKGDTGATGATGQTGQTGATGATPQLSVGTVTSGTTAAVTITGTAENPVLNFVLPECDPQDLWQGGSY